MYKQRIDINQTHIRLKTDINDHNLNFLINNIHNSLNMFISLHKEFLVSLNPVIIKGDNFPEIINLMLNSSKKADVGPMACVAGSISEICLNNLINLGSNYSIIENGGDIAILNNKKVICGIYSNNPVLGNKLAFKLKPRKTPLGICSSSGKIGHSISFGNSDVVTVISDSASLSDGLATSIANEVKGEDSNEAISNGLEFCEKYKQYFKGVLLICDGTIATIGKLPKIVKTEKFSFNKF